MGWITGIFSRKEVVRDLTEGYTAGRVTVKCLKHVFLGYRMLWCLYEIEERGEEGDEAVSISRHAYAYLVARYGANDWGYKGIGHDPSCPLSYLEMVTFDSDRDREWAAEVRQYHARRGTGVKLEVGARIPLRGNSSIPYVDLVSVRPLRGRYEGITYKFRRGQIDLGRTLAPFNAGFGGDIAA